MQHAATKRREAPGGPNVLIGLVDVLDRDDGQVAVVAEVAQGYPGAGLDSELIDLGLVHVERDGNAEEGAIGEAEVGDNPSRNSVLVPSRPGRMGQFLGQRSNSSS
jgi:hypothetical protein